LATDRPRGSRSGSRGGGDGRRAADRLARFTLAAIDGAFIARQEDDGLKIEDLLEYAPAALMALHDRLTT
jgi:hypothetical protein